MRIVRQKLSRGVTRGAVERAARIYTTNRDASSAMGITVRSFSRLCRRYGIETPWARNRRHRQAARRGGGPSP